MDPRHHHQSGWHRPVLGPGHRHHLAHPKGHTHRDGTVRLWDLATGTTLHTLEGHTHEVTAVAVTPDGTRAITTSRDGTARLWDLESAKRLQVFVLASFPTCLQITQNGTSALVIMGEHSGAATVFSA
uniref:WD40 repeat domain-containing protein n=1 Tax=Arthrobacter sp. TaxID=1667 RepID=UPI000EB6DB46|nr:WD40 repeat-containing protein [Arthrobacter sp.]